MVVPLYLACITLPMFAFARVQEGNSAVAFENRYRCKNGDHKWLLWNAVCVPEKQIIYAVARDITKRKEAEDDLRVSEERYRKLFELNPQPAWIYDHETLSFLAVNRAALKAYGYSRDEFLSMTLPEIHLAEDMPALRKSAASLSSDTYSKDVLRHRRKDGGVIQVEITAYSLMFNGRDAEFVIAVDVTERKRTQEERERFTASLEKALEIYYVAEELAKQPENAHLIKHVEEMQRAYQAEFGKPIPPKKK